MADQLFSLQHEGRTLGPFSRQEVGHLIESAIIEATQLVTNDCGEEMQAGEVASSGAQGGETPPPPAPSASKGAWNPYMIAWLGLIFSPVWCGVMATLNARRLALEQPAWRPICIGFGAMAIDVFLRISGFHAYVVSAGLLFGAVWLIWRMELRPQVDAYLSQAAAHPNGGQWLVPLIGGSPLAIAVFAAYVVAPLIPATPASVVANNKALQSWEQGDYENALDLFDEAIRLSPDLINARMNRGILLCDLEQYDKAILDFDYAVASMPRIDEALLWRGDVYCGMGNFARGIEDLNKSILINSSSAESHLIRGIAYLGLEDDERALADLTQAIELDPTSSVAYYWRGVVLFLKEDFPLAIRDFKEAVRLDPDFEAAHKGLAAAEQEISQSTVSQPLLEPWLDRIASQPESSLPDIRPKVPPAVPVGVIRGLFHGLEHGGIGKKLLALLAAIGVGIAAFWSAFWKKWLAK